jgi:hypothetical protein
MDITNVLKNHGIGNGSKIKEFFGDGSLGDVDTGNLIPTSPKVITSAYAGATLPYLTDGDETVNAFVATSVPVDGVIFEVDFITPVSPATFNLKQFKSNVSSTGFKIQCSNDKITWVDANSVTGMQTYFTDYNYNVYPMFARYWRLVNTTVIATITIKEFIPILNASGSITLPSKIDLTTLFQVKSLRVRNGHTLTTFTPSQGLVVLSQGDVTIEGTINMSAKGGWSSTKPRYSHLNKDGDNILLLNGGNGGNGAKAGGQGRLLLGGFGSGGYGGGAYSASGGDAGAILSAEIVISTPSTTPTAPEDSVTGGAVGYSGQGGSGAKGYRGSGGNGGGANGAGGGGGGAGEYASGAYGGQGDYAGGFIGIITKASIIISSTGKLYANGGNGGFGGKGKANGGSYYYAYSGNGGGGAGGGVIALLYKVTIQNLGTIALNGGSGGAGGASWEPTTYPGFAGQPGTSGSVGTIKVQKL